MESGEEILRPERDAHLIQRNVEVVFFYLRGQRVDRVLFDGECHAEPFVPCDLAVRAAPEPPDVQPENEQRVVILVPVGNAWRDMMER